MMKIHVSKVDGDSFKGYINADLLSDDILQALHLNRDLIDVVEVNGEFDIFATNDECYVEGFTSLYLIGADNGQTRLIQKGWTVSKPYDNDLEVRTPKFENVSDQYVFDLDEDQIDIDDLNEQIVSKGDIGEWVADRYASMSDYYHDMLKDS